MPIIRAQQMEVFKTAGLERQVSNVLEFLRARYSEAIAGIPEDELRKKVADGLSKLRGDSD